MRTRGMRQGDLPFDGPAADRQPRITEETREELTRLLTEWFRVLADLMGREGRDDKD